MQKGRKPKEKFYTVHFMTPYSTWESVQATSKEDAIKQCGDPPYEHDMTDFGMFIAIEET